MAVKTFQIFVDSPTKTEPVKPKQLAIIIIIILILMYFYGVNKLLLLLSLPQT